MFEDLGWTREQAGGVIANIDLPPWDADTAWRADLLHDWCLASERDKHALGSQLAFMDYEFRNTFADLGKNLLAAETVKEAADAIRPYTERLIQD
ncbi:MAG: hypothetical protein ACRECF_08900 [Methyloceanibacter sp.]